MLAASLLGDVLPPQGALGGLLGTLWGSPGRSLGALGALLGPSWTLWGALGALLAFKKIQKFPKISERTRNLLSLGLLGCSWTPPGRSELDFWTLRGSILALRGAIWRPSLRQTPSPNSGKVLAKSWRAPGENHSKHSEQPKRMKSQLRCGGLASASSIMKMRN